MNLPESLRDIFALKPSKEGWENLCQQLGTGQIEPWLLDYASKHLESWPDKLKIAPEHWNQALVNSEALDAWDLVRSVECKNYPVRQVSKLVKHPRMRHITSLSFVDAKLGPKSGVRALIKSPNLGSINTLKMIGCFLGEHGAQDILKSTLSTQLHTLHFKASNTFLPHLPVNNGVRWVIALTAARRMTKLRHLMLEGSMSLDKTNMLALAKAPHLQKLESLAFHHLNHIGIFLSHCSTETLRSLNLENAYLSDFHALEPPPLHTLTMDFAAFGHTPDSFKDFCALGMPETLTTLSLNLTNEVDITPLMKAPWVQQLKHLNINTKCVAQPPYPSWKPFMQWIEQQTNITCRVNP